MNQKTLKVQYKSRFASGKCTTVPMIQMTGYWLEQLGFSTGTTVMIEYEDNVIRIRPLTEDEQSALQKRSLESVIHKKQAELDSLQNRLKTTFPLPSICNVAEPQIPYTK